MDNNGNQNKILGLVFLIQVSTLYMLRDDGKICLITVKKNKLNKFNVNKYYEIKNLTFIKRDDRNYFLYNMKKNTLIRSSNIKDAFKNYAIIKMIFLDEINKYYNIHIKLLDNPIYELYTIKNQIQYFSILKNDNSNYFLQSFQLIINKKTKLYEFFIYKREINTINCGLKEDELDKNKSYEIIYLAKNKEHLPKEIKISNYIISNFDKFNCLKRIRFNIMNVKKDNHYYKFNTEVTNLEIIYLINENNKTIKYGVFVKNSFHKEILIDFVIDNDVLNFVNEFWVDFDRNLYKKKPTYIKKYYNSKINLLQSTQNQTLKTKLENNKNIIISKYNKNSINNGAVFNFFRNLYFIIYLESVIKNFNSASHMNYVDKFFNLLIQIDTNKYSNYDKIRILIQFNDIFLYYLVTPLLLDITTLDKDDPYYSAIILQKNIINNLTEESDIFLAILQLNSKILTILPDSYWNYIKGKFQKKKEFAYTISLEDIEDMKTHLLSLQDNFFFILEDKNEGEFNGMYNHDTQITTINQYVLCNDINQATTTDEKNNYSFSINMVFSHERIGHGKEIMYNPGIKSPNIFFNKNFEKDYIVSDYNSEKIGESGRMFESFISSEILIRIMKVIKKFGKFLDFKYFIKDNKEINEKAISLFKGTDLYSYIKRKMKIHILIYLLLLLSALILYMCIIFDIIKISFSITIIILLNTFILILLILIFKDYKKLKEPYKYKYENKLFDFNKKISGKDEPRLIFPDDYPLERGTLTELIFPCFQTKKNEIKKKLLKYVILEKNNNVKF